jgi:hypothetical protein
VRSIRLAWACVCMCIAVWLEYWEWKDESILRVVVVGTIGLAILKAILPPGARFEKAPESRAMSASS